MTATTPLPRPALITRRLALGLAAAPLLLGAGGAWAEGPRTISYGADPLQKLDVYRRPGLSGTPILVFVHGGGWEFGDKAGVNALPAFAERHGLLLVSVGYRKVPQVDAGGCAQDVAAALAWVFDHAAEFGGDPHRLYLMGHSAGAQLVALVGVDPAYLGKHGRAPSDLAGVIPVDGAGYDAAAMLRETGDRPILGRMYREAFGARAAALSPTLLVREGGRYPPFLIFYTDRQSARRRSDELTGRLRAVGATAEVYLAPGKTHMEINHAMGVAGDPEGERVARFIGPPNNK
jgi:arylformamidase